MSTDHHNVEKIEREVRTLQDEITRLEHSSVRMENDITAKKRKYEQEMAALTHKFESDMHVEQTALLKIKQDIAKKTLSLADFKRAIADAHKRDVLDALHGKNTRH